MIHYKSLKFTEGNFIFNLDINNDITYLDGSSGVGKSFVLKSLMNAINSNAITLNKVPVVLNISNRQIYGPFDYNIRNSLIIFDNFDELVMNNPSILNKLDIQTNQLIIVSRTVYKELPFQNWCHCTVERKGDTIYLDYYNKSKRKEVNR